ncbi:MAG: flagellar hook-length control protein FliK [Phycisphaerae bacterium]
MSLIANLFAPVRTTKSSSYPPTSSSQTSSENSPSFTDALDSARQQQAPVKSEPPAQSASKREAHSRRAEKRTSDADGPAEDQAQTTDDSATPSSTDASTQRPSGTDESEDAKPKRAAENDDGKDADDASGDPTAQQIAATAVPQQQQSPQDERVSAEQINGVHSRADTAQAVPVNAPASPDPGKRVAKPAGSGASAGPGDSTKGQSDAPQTLAPDASAETARAPVTPINAGPKKDAESPSAALAVAAKSSGKTDAAAAKNTVADSKGDAAPAPVAKNPPLDPAATNPIAAQHADQKASAHTPHDGQPADASSTTANSTVPAQAQASTPDAALIAQAMKPVANKNTEDSAPAAPQQSTNSVNTLPGNNSPNHAVDNRATPASAAQNSPRTESEQTFDQIVLGLRTKMDATHSKAEISLNPPNLGTLHVSVSLQNGSVTAQFQSSSEVVRDLLKGNMERLKSVLESQGVTVDKLAVGAPQDKTEMASAAPGTAQTHQSANDGRSAGQYSQDSQQNRKRSQDPGAFARTWQQANAKAPIDLVA